MYMALIKSVIKVPNIVWAQYTHGICIQYASSTKVENQFQHYNLCQLGRDPQKVAEIYCLDYKQQLTKKNSDGPSLSEYIHSQTYIYNALR